jgi:hypothetical protein
LVFWSCGISRAAKWLTTCWLWLVIWGTKIINYRWCYPLLKMTRKWKQN